MFLWVTGPAQIGKTTFVRGLEEDGAKVLYIGQILRKRHGANKIAKMDNPTAPDELNEEVEKLVSGFIAVNHKHQGVFVIDGYPRSVEQLNNLDCHTALTGHRHVVLFLDLDRPREPKDLDEGEKILFQKRRADEVGLFERLIARCMRNLNKITYEFKHVVLSDELSAERWFCEIGIHPSVSKAKSLSHLLQKHRGLDELYIRRYGISSNEILKAVGKPCMEPYWKLRYKGACQDIFFLTVYDKIQDQIDIMYNLADKAGYPTSDVGVYIQPIVQGTSCHCEFNLFYDPESPDEVARVRDLSATATRTLMNQGAFFSRPYGESSRIIMNRDAASVVALSRVKKILDPNNVMNPGKLCF